MHAARAAGVAIGVDTDIPGILAQNIYGFPTAPGMIPEALEQRSIDKLNAKVRDVMKTRKGSIKNAPLPPGSPSWDSIEDLTMKDILARRNLPGYNTIWKLLTDGRFAK